MMNVRLSSNQIRGYLNAMLLAIIDEEGEAYAGQIIKRIKEVSKGTVVVSNTAVYRALPRLKSAGLVEDEVRRQDEGNATVVYYWLTQAGREELVKECARVKQFVNIMTALKLLEKQGDGSSTVQKRS